MDMPMHDGFPVEPRSRNDIRDVAVHARRILKLGDGRVDIPRVLDKLSAEFGIHYDVFDKSSAPVPGEVEACYVPEDFTIYIRDTVFSEMANGGSRAVFTFGHEMGHALLGHRRTYNRQSVATVPRYANSEWQANTFSAEFVMPTDQIWKFNLRSAEAIVRQFGVSPVAARVRVDDLTRRNELTKKP